MPYSPQTWENDNPTYPVSAARLTHIEDGIDDAHDIAETAQATALGAQADADTAQSTAATTQSNLTTHAAVTTAAHGGIVATTDTRLPLQAQRDALPGTFGTPRLRLGRATSVSADGWLAPASAASSAPRGGPGSTR